MGKILEPTIAETYGDVVVVSCVWIIMAYAFMPFGPIAGLKKGTAGHQKWCAFFLCLSQPRISARAHRFLNRQRPRTQG